MTGEAPKQSEALERVLLVIVVALVAGAAIWFGVQPGGGGSKVAETTGAAALGSSAVTSPTGLRYEDMVAGSGPSPQKGQTCVVHYHGRLVDGSVFDSSRQRGEPFRFPLGQGSVIKGWDEGVATMKVGGVRRLVVPPALGYGAGGSPPKIPGNATLVFDVELLGIE